MESGNNLMHDIYTSFRESPSGYVYLIKDNPVFNSDLSRCSIKRRERELVRFLVSRNEGQREIGHDPFGAPYLRGLSNTYISISHSYPWACLYLSKTNPVGIDIQSMDKNLGANTNYFVNSIEVGLFELTDDVLYLIWSAKEALFKLKKGRINDLKEDVAVVRIGKYSLTIVYKSNNYEFAFELLNDICLVYSI